MRLIAKIVACVMLGAGAAEGLAQRAEAWVEGLTKPVFMCPDPTSTERFYVVEQGGTIRVIEDGVVLVEPFYEVDRSDFTDKGWEQGLLGMAFDPAYAQNKRFYVNYTARNGATYVSRLTAESARHTDAATEELILQVEQPFGNHNCGNLLFGPDGMLYIGFGDGGSAHDPYGNGQNTRTLLGSLLRIDVTSEPDEGRAYRIPDDNPLGGRRGRGEIWAYGVRNPWGMSFDSTGRLWWADVGQDHWEEINVQPADSAGGENYGWNLKEGLTRFRRGPAGDGRPLEGLTDPVFVYEHHPTGSVTGGHYYEGSRVPSLTDRYICADFMSGRVWTFRLGDDGKAADVLEVSENFGPAFDGNASLSISCFGRGLDNELYIVDHKRGRVLRIVE